MTNSLSVIAGLTVGICLILLFSVAPIPNMIPTTPKLTEDEAFTVMKDDIQSRAGEATVALYGRPPRVPDNDSPLPLLYYSSELGRQYNINARTHEITGSCVPSIMCGINITHSDIDKTVDGKLVYFLDGIYSAKTIDSPAYYFVDAMNGDVLWSYIGEDVHPELQSK